MGHKHGRIPMLERDQVAPEVAALYDALEQQRGVVPYMFKTLAHTPALALGIAGFLKRSASARSWGFARPTACTARLTRSTTSFTRRSGPLSANARLSS